MLSSLIQLIHALLPFISSKRWIDDFSHKIFLSRLCYSLINALGDDHRSSKRNLELVLELFVIPFCSLTRTKERGFFFLWTRDVTVIIFRSNFPFRNRNWRAWSSRNASKWKRSSLEKYIHIFYIHRFERIEIDLL